MRISIGFVISFWGVGKFAGGYSQFVSGIQDHFSSSWLPAFAVHLFAVLLPFSEVVLGLLLVVGLFTVYAAALEAIAVIALSTGMQIAGDASTVAHNLIYSFILCALVFLAEHNGFSLDRLLFRRREG